MHTQYDSIHTQGYAAACVRWIYHQLASDECGEVIWGQAESVLHRGGPLGLLQAAPHTYPVGTIR